MLEHQKLILDAVSDNNELFRKELYKSLVWLNPYEVGQLRKWIKEKYGSTHKSVIREVFHTEAA